MPTVTSLFGIRQNILFSEFEKEDNCSNAKRKSQQSKRKKDTQTDVLSFGGRGGT